MWIETKTDKNGKKYINIMSDILTQKLEKEKK
ncbi:hypothetical protein EDAG_05657 [Enterococcus faecium D344SRF]|nr:hypothetical protein EDAG_05657 [Enterococcus faecium D344SRF]